MNDPALILYLEDNPRDAKLVRDRLQQTPGLACKLRVASNRAEYEAALAEARFDLIFSDYSLPNYDGMAALALAREKQPEVPFILISGVLGEEQAVDCVLRGATDYVLKQRLDRLVPAVLRALTEAEEHQKRREAEESLRESERELKEAQRLGRIGHWQFDVKAQRIRWSDMVFAIYKRDPKRGPPTVEEEAAYYSSQDAERLRDCARRAIEASEPYEIEVRVNLPEGRIADVVAIGTPVKDAHGRVVSLMGTVQDITERKQAQDALEESELKYRQVVENASEAIFVAQHKSILFANPATSALIGYSSEELLARPFVDFVHPDDRDMVLERYYVWMKGEELPRLYAFRVVRKDGKVRWAELNTVLIDWKGEPATLNLASDITESREASDRLRRSLEGTIQALALTTEMRDPYTAGHQERVTRLACAIAGKMGLSEERAESLRVAGLLHDVGKISIPAEILSKPTTLTPTEFSLVKAHPQTGYEILKGIDFPGPVAEIVLEHHERLDGCGYPRGLKGEAILLEAKILAVADVVEAMASHRPYRPALGIEVALETTSKEKGTLYDPAVVEACIRLFSEGRFAFER